MPVAGLVPSLTMGPATVAQWGGAPAHHGRDLWTTGFVRPLGRKLGSRSRKLLRFRTTKSDDLAIGGDGARAHHKVRCRTSRGSQPPIRHPKPATMPTVTDSPPPTYRLTEEQVLLRDAVRTLAEERVAPRAAEIDKTGEFPEDLRQLLAAQDILALPFPEEHGGLGADLLTICLAVEQLSRACATTGLILAVQELASLPLLLAGTDEQKARFVPKLASGEHLIAFALTEAEAGSDVAAIRTTATRDGDDYVLNGSKRFISHGSVADLITVFAVTGTDPDAETPRRDRLSCFVVEVPTAGLRRRPHRAQDGDARQPHGRACLRWRPRPRGQPDRRRGRRVRPRDEDVRSQPARDRRPGRRHRPGRARCRDRLCARPQAVRQARSATSRWSGAMLADMDAATEAARQLLYKACVEIEAGAPDASRWSAMCKLVAGDAAMRVTTDAVQVLGGYGYIDEFPVERMMRDAKLTQLYEGTQQIQRLVVARALLGKDQLTRERGHRFVRIVVLVKPVPDPASAGERLGPDGRLDRAAVPAVVNGNDEYVLEAALKLIEAPAGRGHAAVDGTDQRARDAAQGARDGRDARRPRDRPGARRLRPRLDGEGPGGGAPGRSSTTWSSPASTSSDGVGGVVPAGDRGAPRPAVPLLRREIEPDMAAGTVRVRRISATGYDVLEAPMPGRHRWHPGARRAALPVAQGDHGRAVEGDRDAVAGRPRARRRRRRRRGRDDRRPRQQAPPARGGHGVVRGTPPRAPPGSSTSSPSGGSSDGRRSGSSPSPDRTAPRQHQRRGRDPRPDLGAAAGRDVIGIVIAADPAPAAKELAHVPPASSGDHRSRGSDHAWSARRGRPHRGPRREASRPT